MAHPEPLMDWGLEIAMNLILTVYAKGQIKSYYDTIDAETT